MMMYGRFYIPMQLYLYSNKKIIKIGGRKETGYVPISVAKGAESSQELGQKIGQPAVDFLDKFSHKCGRLSANCITRVLNCFPYRGNSVQHSFIIF